MHGLTARKSVQVGNECVLELMLDKKAWHGIGAVTIDGIPMRDGTRPLMLRIETPEGVIYTDYVLKSVETSRSGVVTVNLAASGYPGCRQEYLDEYEQPQFTLMAKPQRVVDNVTLRFTPVKEKLGGRVWQGFAYQVAFRSRERSIHRLTVDATWELGGSIAGNTVLSQSQCNPPVYRGKKATLFTTSVLKALHMYGSPQGVSFQMAPRAALLQGFDFQYGKDGALLNYWPEMDSISSVIESPRGSTLLHVVDEYRFSLAKQVTTTPQRVLFTPGPMAEHEARDLWWEAIETIYGGLRKKYKVAETLVRPEGHKVGCPSARGGSVLVSVMGHEVEHQDWMYAIAEHYLPRLARNGIKKFWMDPVCQSDTTEMGMHRKLDRGVYGDLHCGSICCTWRFFPSDYWGGIKAWKHLYKTGRKLGIQIGTWAAPHFSHNAPIFKKHPEWKITGVNSLVNGGGYGIHAIHAVDWNTAIFDWVLADFRRWKKEGGLDFLWLDSWSNLGLLPINYAGKMRTNWSALSRFCGELSQMGIELSFESLSPFGVMECGFMDLRGYKTGEDHSVAGQNDFGWWVGEEDMLYNVSMYNIHPCERQDNDLFDIKFKAMANRGFVMLPSLLGNDHDMPERHILLHQAYEQVLPNMRTRRLLPGGTGVRWSDGKTGIIWTFRDDVLPVGADCKVFRVVGNDRELLSHDGLLKLEAKGIYMVTRS